MKMQSDFSDDVPTVRPVVLEVSSLAVRPPKIGEVGHEGNRRGGERSGLHQNFRLADIADGSWCRLVWKKDPLWWWILLGMTNVTSIQVRVQRSGVV